MTDAEQGEWHFIGKHAFRFEVPDLIHTRPYGDMSVEQYCEVLDYMESLPKPEKGLYILTDARNGGRSDPAIVKIPEIRNRMPHNRATVYFNASFFHRTMIGIFQRANKVLKLMPVDAPVMIFDSEEEARAWIDEHRKTT